MCIGWNDQGWWPDGIYTAPTDEALMYDIQVHKQLGFNMIRKHVKVESRRWYYHCDRLGMLVWQDMPAGRCESLRGSTRSEASGRRLAPPSLA
jgi:beta-galactosidase/beta-glucuronidase